MKKATQPKKQWSEMTNREKNTKIVSAVVILVVILFVFGAITGNNKSTSNTQPATSSSSTKPVLKQAKTTPVAPKYTFDIPSLLGKNIDEIRQILGAPSDGDMTEPTAEQVSLGASQWDNTFKKDGKELVVTFSPSTRKVVDFFIGTDDPSGKTTDEQHLLDIGNLTKDNSSYTVEPVKAIKDPSVITGVIIRQ